MPDVGKCRNTDPLSPWSCDGGHESLRALVLDVVLAQNSEAPLNLYDPLTDASAALLDWLVRQLPAECSWISMTRSALNWLPMPDHSISDSLVLDVVTSYNLRTSDRSSISCHGDYGIPQHVLDQSCL